MSKRKIIRLIILLLIILIILLTIFLYIKVKNRPTEIEQKFQYINSDEWNGELYPEGMPKLFRSYSGNLTCQNIGKSFNYVVNDVIPNYSKMLKDHDETYIKTYFDENKEDIAMDVGIKNSEDFYNFIEKIKESIKIDDVEFESFYIDTDSIKQQSNITKTKLCIKYKNCDQLDINIKISGNKNQKSSAIEYK